MNLTVEKVLVYYDVPQVFSAKDAVGSHYLCLLVDEEGNNLQYLTLPISQGKLTKVVCGLIDLREAFVNSEMQKWFIAKVTEQEVLATEAPFKVVPEEYLPEEGYYCELYSQSEEAIVSEILERENAIVHIAISDGSHKNSIKVNILSSIAKAFQDLIKYISKKAKIDEADYSLRAFGSSIGSFNIHLENEGSRDMYKQMPIEYALKMINEILNYEVGEDAYIEKLKEVKGHSIGILKKIVSEIIEENVSIKYKWGTPSSANISIKVLNIDRALKIKEILDNASDELQEEEIIFEGIAKKVDVKGEWRILNEADNKEYSGKAVDTDLLSGITTDTKKYRFICTETISFDKITDKEKIKYTLKRIEDAIDTLQNENN